MGRRKGLAAGVDEVQRTVAQLGSAPDWGSGGRRFKSCQSDNRHVYGVLWLTPRSRIDWRHGYREDQETNQRIRCESVLERGGMCSIPGRRTAHGDHHRRASCRHSAGSWFELRWVGRGHPAAAGVPGGSDQPCQRGWDAEACRVHQRAVRIVFGVSPKEMSPARDRLDAWQI